MFPLPNNAISSNDLSDLYANVFDLVEEQVASDAKSIGIKKVRLQALDKDYIVVGFKNEEDLNLYKLLGKLKERRYILYNNFGARIDAHFQFLIESHYYG